MRKIAKEIKVVLFGGSIPTRKDGKLYNTCFVFDSDGTLIATHHKLHLFDVDIPAVSYTHLTLPTKRIV